MQTKVCHGLQSTLLCLGTRQRRQGRESKANKQDHSVEGGGEEQLFG